MDLSVQTNFDRASLDKALRDGIEIFGVPVPQNLDEWASQHYYLSAESSYVEKRWTPWWFQRAIMCCISNDDIREIDWRKSARTGATKILGAAIAYFAEHKRRNQILWQPTDTDRDEWVKTELDPMLRDVAIMRSVFPAYLKRDKHNTLTLKQFLGSTLHIKGGTAAGNYRRVSVDCAWLDEYDAFLANIEKEGDPGTLAEKRIEGATFPKIAFFTTPKLKGFSNVEKRESEADYLLHPVIPCPDCGGYHPLTWGGPDEAHGMKWQNDDPETVRHLCPHCGTLIEQAQYLAIADAAPIVARYQTAEGITLDHLGTFRSPEGDILPAQAHVAFTTWSAYSPNVSWVKIVRDFIAAQKEADEGKKEKLQTFVNTTLGEYWAEECETTDENELRDRAEAYPLQTVPRGGLILLAGGDVQDNRIEVNVWAYGRGCESWIVDDQVFFGNPQEDAVWEQLEQYLFNTEISHTDGARMRIHATAIDTQGHNTQAVYAFCEKHNRRRVYAVAGVSGKERAIKHSVSTVKIDFRGKKRKTGLKLWSVGTNKAKDRIYGRLYIPRPGPGYVHFCKALPESWYRQYTAESRVPVRSASGEELSRWFCPPGKRNEKWDCHVYATWLEEHLDLPRKSAKFWDDLEAKIQPVMRDLFAPENIPAPQKRTQAQPPETPPPEAKPAPRPQPKPIAAKSDWSSRL